MTTTMRMMSGWIFPAKPRVWISGEFTRRFQRNQLIARKPQGPVSNVAGIGKWAHSSTGVTPVAPQASPARGMYRHSTAIDISADRAVASTSGSASVNQTTEYIPAARPGQRPSSTISVTNPPIPSAVPSSSAQASVPAPSQVELRIQQIPTPTSGPQSTYPPQTNGHLPPSSYPPITAQASHPLIDPTNPSGIIPSSGDSIYEIDLNQFESSGQPWRKPGSDLSQWFNFGFDEVTFPKFLRYRMEMEMGRNALVSVTCQLCTCLLLIRNRQILTSTQCRLKWPIFCISTRIP
jgi:pre-mRNA 3'-end-processing factor FIP1